MRLHFPCNYATSWHDSDDKWGPRNRALLEIMWMATSLDGKEPLWCHPWGINYFWSSPLLSLSLPFQKTVPPPDFDCSWPAVQSLCLTILCPFSQKFTLVTKLPIHSVNFLLHLFLISLSDFFAKLCHFPSALANLHLQRDSFILDQNPLSAS